jgi:hypothetical protein
VNISLPEQVVHAVTILSAGLIQITTASFPTIKNNGLFYPNFLLKAGLSLLAKGGVGEVNLSHLGS